MLEYLHLRSLVGSHGVGEQLGQQKYQTEVTKVLWNWLSILLGPFWASVIRISPASLSLHLVFPWRRWWAQTKHAMEPYLMVLNLGTRRWRRRTATEFMNGKPKLIIVVYYVMLYKKKYNVFFSAQSVLRGSQL